MKSIIFWLLEAMGICIAMLLVSGRVANAGPCPAVGADTGCGVLITITNGGVVVSSTGQGPFDSIEDTLVGVINNSNNPIRALGLKSSLGFFALDGDGICGSDPFTGLPYTVRPVGCPFGPTGYEGPGVSFSNISTDKTTGTVNFSVPITSDGGTAYFSLEENLSTAIPCQQIVNNSVSTSLSGRTLFNGFFLNPTTISATFKPNFGINLAQAKADCGFTNFDWVQKVTNNPDPSPFFQNNPADSSKPIHLTSASTPFNDPAQFGYTYCVPTFGVNCDGYPFYFNPDTTGNIFSLATYETMNTLSFSDHPSNPCLPGGSSANVPGCNGSNSPSGSFVGFTTDLVGILADSSYIDLGIGFSWNDTFNGTNGGIAMLTALNPVDPDSGIGGITITNVVNTTNYDFQAATVTVTNVTSAVPEPISVVLLTSGLFLLWLVGRKGSQK